MRYVEFHPGQISLLDGERSDLPVGWARIAVRACGVCGTDLHTLEGMVLPPGIVYPLRPGHEVAGIVTEINGDASKSGIEVGASVVLHPLIPCGECTSCRSGAENRCADAQTLGFHQPGGMAEEVVWPIDRLVNVDDLPFEQAALLADAVATAYRAFTVAAPPPGAVMCVLGAGGVGTHLLQIAAALDPTLQLVTVVRSEATAARAAEMGVAAIVGLDDSPRALRARFGPADVVVDFSGATRAPRIGLRMLRPGGRLVLGSVNDEQLELGTSITALMMREVQVCGTYTSTIADLRAATDLVRSGGIDLRASASLRFPLADVDAALRTVKERPNGLVRVVVLP
jgi:propanol-preferring alcohol dehydrogenase